MNKCVHKLKKTSALAGILAALQIMATIPVQALGKTDVSSSVMQPLINETTTALAPGVKEKRVTYKDTPYGFRTECFCIDVDSGNQSSISLGTPDDGDTYKMQTVRDQANASAKNGKNIVAAVNGDYYDMATGEPQGAEIKNGVEVHPNKAGEPFFGIEKDGTPVIDDANAYQQIKGTLKEAIGGPRILVKDGAPVIYNDSLYPCAAAGIRADHSVFFLVIDGAQYPYSEGITLADLAKMLADMGAKQALMLDGGGSATCVDRTPGDSGLSCKNRPSDGWERAVGNSILISSNVKPDGKFASAYITPYDKTYTPKSAVQMKATGLDASGAAAALPASGLAWSLSDPSFGTIDSNGLMTSNGKTGQVQVILSYEGKTVGTTNLEFAVPDDFYFQNKSLSMDLNQTQSLNLVARYQERDVVLNGSNIVWKVPAGLGAIEEDGTFRSGSKSGTGTVTASLAGTGLTAAIDLTIGKAPVVLCDFEKSDDYKSWYTHVGASRGQTCSMDFSTYPEEPARFGDHALKLNFDFTTGAANSTLDTYAGPPAGEVAIPGEPTAIGMWVYATPESQGEWLWVGITDSKGMNKGLYLTSQQTGINWIGWKYIEAPIPSGAVAPYAIRKGDAVGLFCVKSGMAGYSPMTKGCIYVDNIRAVYGSNNDDLTSPIIDSVTTDGKVYTASGVSIAAYVHDDMTDSNATGLNWDRAKIIVDGKDYSSDKLHFSYDRDGKLNLRGINWPDGIHKVTVDIQDNFGNETTKDSYFTVNSGSGTKVGLTSADTAVLGGNYSINLTTNNVSDIKGVTAKIKVTKDFPVAGVTFAPSVKDGSSYTYDANTGIVSINIGTPSSPAAKGAADLAAISVNVPKSAKTGSKLEYDVESSSVAYNSGKGGNYAATFSAGPASVPVTATYNLKLQNSIVGKDGSLLVTDQTGKAVSGADVTMTKSDGSSADLGKTGSDGSLASPALTSSAQKFTLQAEKDGQYSFAQSVQSYNPVKDKTPANILSGSTSDPTTEKSITWMSNPLTSGSSAVMKYASTADLQAKGEAAFQKVSGNSQILYYDNDSSAVRENSAAITGLKPGIAYSYRVGDGTNWSDVMTFTTLTNTDKFTFNVFGDTQSTETGGLDDLSGIFTRIENSQQQPLFSIHVGDFVDDEQTFSQINATAAMFDQHPKFRSIDMIHVLGNHEYQGDDGTKGSLIYGVPQNGPSANQKGCYSMNYGNMHISVIGWTDNENVMRQELEWLRHDVKSNNKTWYVVATHQPVYNKNPDDPSTLFNKMLSPVCDELGIDFVFSGHDHSYGRTYPLVGGKQVTDGSGTVYVCAGHTAEKTYDISPADPSAYASVQQNKDDKFYLTGSVNGSRLTITAQKADGTPQDTYTATAKKRADKKKLEEVLSNYGAYKQNDYSADSWNAFQNVLNAAQKPYNDWKASQADVDAAVQALGSAASDLKLIDTGVSDIVGSLGDRPSHDEVADAVKRIKGHLTAAAVGSSKASGALQNLDRLLQNACGVPAPAVSVKPLENVGKDQQMTNALSIPGLLVAAGVTGAEPQAPAVTLRTTQDPTSDVLSFDFSLTVNNKPVHDLAIPAAVTFQFPGSFQKNPLYSYNVLHRKADGSQEMLPLTIGGTSGAYTGTFMTDSFSDFTVVAAAPTPVAPVAPITSIVTPEPAAPAAFISDTTADFSVTGAYTFKITSKDGKAPTFVVGTPGVFSAELVRTDGNDYYFRITAAGKPGSSAGIYINGGARLLIATVKSNAHYDSDTTSNLTVSGAYTFKITGKDGKAPTFVVGTPGVFSVNQVKIDGNDYYFKITAIGKSGTGTGIYIDGCPRLLVAAVK